MRVLLAVPAAVALVAASLGVTHAPRAGAGRDEGRWFTLALPPGWARTAGFSCQVPSPPPDSDCYEVAHYRGPDGAWLRVVVDPPAEPDGFDAVLPAVMKPDGRIDPERTVPTAADGQRAIAVTADAAGRRYLFLYGGAPGEDLAPFRSALAGFAAR